MAAVPVWGGTKSASCVVLKRSKCYLWMSQTDCSRPPGDRACTWRYLNGPPGLLCRLQKGFISYAGSKMGCGYAAYRLCGVRETALWPHRHCQAVLEASDPRLATVASLHSGIMQHVGLCAWKQKLTSQEQSLFLACLLSRAPPLKTFFPFCFKQDYDIFWEDRNEQCAGEVSSVQDSPCQGVL